MPEFFVAIGDLINGSFLQAGSLWVLTNVPGFPPIIQTIHILGIAVIMGTAVLLNLRLLGLAVPSQNITEMTKRSTPILYFALISNFISGSFFVFGRPSVEIFPQFLAVLVVCVFEFCCHCLNPEK